MKVLKNQEGLTLIEAIVALVLMIVLVAAFSGAFVTGLNREVEVDKRMSASSLANSMFEYIGEGNRLNQLKNSESEISFDDLSDEFLDDFDEDLIFDSLIKDRSYILIEESNNNGTSDLYKITINIGWEDRDNNHDLKVKRLMVDD